MCNVILIAGATNLKDTFKDILDNVVCGRALNCFSKQDMILNKLYDYTIQKKATGDEPNYNLPMENVETSYGHTEYRDNFTILRKKLNINFI